MCFFFFFFFNDPAPTEIYPLPLHDALPISARKNAHWSDTRRACCMLCVTITIVTSWTSSAMVSSITRVIEEDRKSTRLNSSHQIISYAVFCLKKKKTKQTLIDHAVYSRSGP